MTQALPPPPRTLLFLALLLLFQACGPSYRSIHEAARKGDVEAVLKFIKRGVAVDSVNAKGETPLLIAAYEGKTLLLETLLQNGADANARNGEGYTALHLAAANGYDSMIRPLLDHKAEINTIGGEYKMTPLDLALTEGRGWIAETLRDHGGKEARAIDHK